MQERFKTVDIKGQIYIFDRRIFQTMILSLLFLFVLAWVVSGDLNPWDKQLELTCKGPGYCANPYYQGDPFFSVPKGVKVPSWLLSEEFLPPGFSLQKPNPIAKNFGSIVGLLILISFVVNHLLHNRTFDFKNLGWGEHEDG